MPKILIVCDVYPPSFAPRMGYLVKYMKEWGWEADVLTRIHDGDFSFESLRGNTTILRADQCTYDPNRFWGKLQNVFGKKKQYRCNRDKLFHLGREQVDPGKYSFILCSTAHRIFVLEAAHLLAKAWKKPLIADLRDLAEQKPKLDSPYQGLKKIVFEKTQENFSEWVLRKRNKIFSKTDCLITVSPWHQEIVRKYNQNTHLIYNGFDPENYYPVPPERNEVFRIVYTGTTLPGCHDPTLLFKATGNLDRQQVIDPDSFRLDFYVPSNWRRTITSNEYFSRVEKYVSFFDYIDTSEVPALLRSASLLLLLSNKMTSDGPKGLISTTKYFEYLAVERPILCVRSDESLLEASIKEANAGVAARTVAETRDFILEKWREWREKGYTTVRVNRAYTQQFSRKKQAGQFVRLFEQVLQAHQP